MDVIDGAIERQRAFSKRTNIERSGIVEGVDITRGNFRSVHVDGAFLCCCIVGHGDVVGRSRLEAESVCEEEPIGNSISFTEPHELTVAFEQAEDGTSFALCEDRAEI